MDLSVLMKFSVNTIIENIKLRNTTKIKWVKN